MNWNILKETKGVENSFTDCEKITTSEFIRDLRLDLCMTQSLFSKILGIDQETLNAWEKGTVQVKGANSRLLYLLSKHPELLDDLYTLQDKDTA